jgi:hypothetical protein
MPHQPILVIAIIKQHDKTSDKLLETTNRGKGIDYGKVGTPNLSFLVRSRKLQMILEVSHDNFPLRSKICRNVDWTSFIAASFKILDGRNLLFFPIFCKHTDICVQVELFYPQGSFES